MSKNLKSTTRTSKKKEAHKKAVKASVEQKVAKPDVTVNDAVIELKNDIINEAIKIQEGKVRSVYPLVKLVDELKELRKDESFISHPVSTVSQ